MVLKIYQFNHYWWYSAILLDQCLFQSLLAKLSSAVDRILCSNPQPDYAEREFLEHTVLNGMSPSNPYTHSSGNPTKKEVERVKEPE